MTLRRRWSLLLQIVERRSRPHPNWRNRRLRIAKINSAGTSTFTPASRSCITVGGVKFWDRFPFLALKTPRRTGWNNQTDIPSRYRRLLRAFTLETEVRLSWRFDFRPGERNSSRQGEWGTRTRSRMAPGFATRIDKRTICKYICSTLLQMTSRYTFGYIRRKRTCGSGRKETSRSGRRS